ncbi:hypothetical protein B0H11DRAFT_2289051 [Mycena galericulata]|nr:hypothetical protein B0H11DRAFT_2289051 [Mycena galericulata]
MDLRVVPSALPYSPPSLQGRPERYTEEEECEVTLSPGAIHLRAFTSNANQEDKEEYDPGSPSGAGSTTAHSSERQEEECGPTLNPHLVSFTRIRSPFRTLVHTTAGALCI